MLNLVAAICLRFTAMTVSLIESILENYCSTESNGIRFVSHKARDDAINASFWLKTRRINFFTSPVTPALPTDAGISFDGSSCCHVAIRQRKSVYVVLV